MCALHHMPRIMFDLLQLLIAIGVGIVITGLCVAALVLATDFKRRDR
ncbi:hypothetical protein [Chelativorans multitrophicus]|nr:hypothetical protein [Chelativorans multitrophicus]